MAGHLDSSGQPIPTSSVLMASSKHIGTRCHSENVAFLKCKKKDPNPEKCLDTGREVTRCVLGLWANSVILSFFFTTARVEHSFKMLGEWKNLLIIFPWCLVEYLYMYLWRVAFWLYCHTKCCGRRKRYKHWLKECVQWCDIFIRIEQMKPFPLSQAALGSLSFWKQDFLYLDSEVIEASSKNWFC